MKPRLFNILFFSLVTVYVFSTIGISVISHYCGGKLEEVSVFSKPSSCCDMDDDSDSDCCKNDHKHIALQSDFTFYTQVSDCKIAVMDLFMIHPSFIKLAIQPQLHTFFLSLKKAHPPNLIQDDIVAFSVIRI